MAQFPHFKLYASDGVTLIYEFNAVIDINDWQDPASFVEHSSLRGQGSIISEGSNEPWDLNIKFLLQGTDYEDLVSQISSVQTTIDKFTKYILKVDLTPSTTKDYYVMRLSSFNFPLDRKKKRVNLQTVELTLRVDSWS